MTHPAIQPAEEAVPAGPRPLKPGERVEAVVTGLARYGVFVATREGHRGLVHISEVSDRYVRDVRDYFAVGETVTVEVIGRQEGTDRYAFSTRRVGGKLPLRAPAPVPERPGRAASSRTPRPGASQDEELICRFLTRRVGPLSEEARGKVRELVRHHGGVRVALALAEAGRRFGSPAALLNWVDRQLAPRREERARWRRPAPREVRARPAGL